MNSKIKLPFIPTLSVVIFLAAALLWWVNPLRVLAGFQILPVSLRSPLTADYSADPRLGRIKPLQLGIIEEAIRDRQAAANAEQIIVGLNSPVPTITPMPGAINPTSASGLPTLTISFTPTAQGTTPIPSMTPSSTGTLTHTPSRTFASTSTNAAATQQPTHTAAPRTNTPGSPSNTPQLPTQMPTHTQRPATYTAVPPTRTPPPPTPTRNNPYPPPASPTSGPTQSYP